MSAAPAQPSTPDTPLDHALAYARRGWRVIPIPPGLKFPKGFPAWQHDGSTDEAKIRHWWTAAPDHGIGIVTGAASKIWVLDIDVADGKAGDDTLAELEAAYGPLPATYEVITGSGGRHLYFDYGADGQQVRNSASGRLGPGIDVRGEGGFVVAPPSIHANGNPYQRELGAPDHIAIAPAWILGLLEEPEADTHRAQAERPPTGDRPGDLWAAATSWASLLEGDGWTLGHVDRSGEEHWVRPGKDKREGTSATVGYMGSDVLKVFTSSMTAAGLHAEQTYSKIGYLAATRFGGVDNIAEAASWCRSQGHHAAPPPALDDLIGDSLRGGTAASEPWDEPRLPPATQAAPPFPIHVLPSWCQDHTLAVADQVQVSADLAAMLIIGSLSAAATGRAKVHVSTNWTENVNLYLVAALKSGAGKSPAEKLCASWLRQLQRDRMERAMPEFEEKRQLLRIAEKRHAALERNSLVDHDILTALRAVAAARGEVPELPRMLADDTTPEAVATLLKNHGERLSIISTEADLFDMLMRGKAGQRASMNIYLKAWSGDGFIRDRKGGQDTGPEYFELRHPLLSITITVQPAVLARVLGDEEMASRGFAARFMVTVPPDLIGHRDQSRRFIDTRLATTAPYEAEATRLAERWARWTNPADLRLDDGARSTLEAFLVEIEPQLADGEPLAHLAEWSNKLHGSIARYAGLLHLAEGNDTAAPIEAPTMARAVDLGRYWLGHAVVAAGFQGEIVLEQADAVLGWITAAGTAQATLAEIQNGIRRPGIGLDKVADYVPAVELLIDLGWLRPLDPGDWRSQVGVRRSPSPRFALWPDAIGRPQRVNKPRSPRTASMGESFLSISLSTQPSFSDPRGTRFTRFVDSPPTDSTDLDPWDLGLTDPASTDQEPTP